MKYYIIMGILLSGLNLKSQVYSNHELPLDSNKIIYMTQKAGSCASPDGPMNSISAPPGSYAYLQANGYCNPNTYGTNPTVCWTFTPTSSSVSINSGYSQTGCANVAFGSIRLFNSSCTQIGTGTNFTGLTPGQSYTWCITGVAWGGGPGCAGFTDFCPYYINNSTLPVELAFFDANLKSDYILISWVTLTEVNNNYFTIEKSTDAKLWDEYYRMPGAGNTNTPSSYEFQDHDISSEIIYYRLVQTDYDGNFKVYNPVAIKIPVSYNIPTPYDVLGKKIIDIHNYKGLIIYRYKYNKYKKVIIID